MNIGNRCAALTKSGRSSRRNERGIALLLTIFGLLLLTAVAVAMLFSSDSETLIALNYRDKEVATYAALSGVQEARDRLQPLYGDLVTAGLAPTQLPAVNNGQVLYIVNPGPGETVNTIAPWKANISGKPNPYFDKELCQENIAGLSVTGTPGVPCTSAQPGNAWYTAYDNSANTTNWQLADASGNKIPLDYKWVRVTLKADNSAPVYVQTAASPADGTHQVCWDTRYDQQLQKPATAGTDCLGGSTGSAVSAVNLVTGGSGYSSTPSVTFTGGGGSGATATAQLTTIAGGISSATLSNTGSGYTTSPTVSITNPDGTGAAFKALVVGSPVTALALGSTNYCYQLGTTGLTANFSPSPPPTAGGSATATLTMTGQSCISGFTASASCKSKKGTSVTISSVPGGSGSGFSGTVVFDAAGKVSSSTIQNVGSYTAVPAGSQTITVSGCAITASFSGGIQLSNVSLTGGGEYVTAPTATVSGTTPKAPSSTQPTLNVTWSAGANNGKLNGVQVTTAGSGYAVPTANYYTLAFTGGGGSGAIGTATSNATTKVSGLTLTSGGSGYTSVPSVVIGGPGAGASATAALSGGQQLLLGRVYMLTAMAVTKTGSQSMAQMEAAVKPPWKFQLGGALTLAGANPNFGTPNSNIFKINGNDTNSCGETTGANLPAIGVYDSAAQTSVVSGLGKPNNYIGAQSAPDVQVVAAANPDTSELTQMVSDITHATGTVNVTGPATNSSLASWGTASNLQTIVVNGDLTLSGNPSGYGVLVVTGNLTLNGDFSWHGVVLVIGSATVNNQGGGNGQITGAMYVANSTGGTLGSSTFNWNGGGGNGIQYDHCWADDLLNKYPPLTSDDPLQVLSTRVLEF